MDRVVPLSLGLAAAEPLWGLLPSQRTLHDGGGRMESSQGERATGKGPWQSVLHSPFFRGRMFWEEGVCWQPDPPSGCGDLQSRLCWQLTFLLLLLAFFSPLFSLQIHPQTDLLTSHFFPMQHKHSHVPVTSSCAPPHQETSPHCLCGSGIN